MEATQLGANQASLGLSYRDSRLVHVKRLQGFRPLSQRHQVPTFDGIFQPRRAGAAAGSRLSVQHRDSFFGLVTHQKSSNLFWVNSQFNPDRGVESPYAKSDEDNETCSSAEKLPGVKGVQDSESRPADVKREVVMLSLPAIAGQAIDPLAQLMETAYIGRLGSVELGSAGVSMSIFNIISKLFNIPLLSVATSFVAKDISKAAIENLASGPVERKQLSSVSTALLLAVGIGMFEALALSLASGPFLRLMGVQSTSEMFVPARQFLMLRALGAPAFVISLALQGVFRGFKDTKTPVYCLGVGNFLAVFLFPLFIYQFQMGIAGAAISTVISQYTVAVLMMWSLNKRVILLPPKMGSLKFGDYIKSGGFVLGRTLSVLMTMTFATSMAARQGTVAMAAHQICMQVWLAVSLLTDALAASGQALIASSASKRDFKSVKEVADFVLKIGLITGISLAIILGLSFRSLAGLFSKDPEVLRIVRTGVLFVTATQPITALAFIFDGLHYGMSDFPYAACSMMVIGAISSAFLLYAPSTFGLHGVWFGLSLFMGLRMMAGFARLMWRNGPWWFMHADLHTAKQLAH
ncbi:PREDICTED: protein DETOXIFICATION 45, chloroplastic [Tarenaya hassleriana]|uniref:protein DETOXIFICATION 45, chloroplastic n=1 Tax=Tarenaya hassleriana TaxID=28532 RepID=UPI00053C1BF6|nr:PREDICTED: protein DETOXIFICATION 45, chloroplastic [Tarenaya hassleriana]XP_010555178.1 PREDICTED: protein DETOXIFICATION 45, chloroplastic [Tarenaya hassleriana]